MAEPPSIQGLRSDRIWLRIGAPILALMLICILGAFAVFWNFAKQQDRAFERDSALLVSSAIAGHKRGLSNSVLDYAFWNDAYRRISLRWDSDWIETNFISTAADGMVIFTPDQKSRYAWLAAPDGLDVNAVGALVARNAGAPDELLRISAEPEQSERTLSNFVVLGDDLAVISTSPVAWEPDQERLHGLAVPRHYVSAIDVLSKDELTVLGESLGLEQLSFTLGAGATARESSSMTFPIRDSEGKVLGGLTWRNERPGTAAFAGQVLPITLGLLFFGGLCFLVSRQQVLRHLQEAARAEAALESSRLKSEFIATMSHELRTPLNAIIGYSELIQEQISDEDFSRDVARVDLGRIRTAGQHLLKLVNDILHHSRLDARGAIVSLEDVNVAQALHEAAEIIRPLAYANGNALEVSAETADVSIAADPRLLAQCLLNLAGNAVKFTKNGKIELQARRAEIDGKSYIAVDVTDTGIGIEPQALGRLFAPFQQANPAITREYGGAGLGLSITRRLARSMGGDVVVASTLGSGSRFTLLLPAAARPQLQLVA